MNTTRNILMARKEFGPPIAISDDFEPYNAMTIREFRLRPTPEDDYLRWAFTVNRYKLGLPSEVDVEEYLQKGMHDFTDDEIAGFRQSISFDYIREADADYRLAHDRKTDGVVPPSVYVSVAIRLSQWTVGKFSDGITSETLWVARTPMNLHSRNLQSFSDSEVTTLMLDMVIPETVWSTIDYFSVDAILFVLARCPNALRSGLNPLRAKSRELARYNGITIEPLLFMYDLFGALGKEWLAWLLLLDTQVFSYRDKSQAILELIELSKTLKALPSFDECVPYVQAGIPLDAIGAAVENGIALDIASTIQT